MKKGLGARLRELFGLGIGGEEFYEELEDTLIEGDLGASTAVAVVAELKEYAKRNRLQTREDLRDGLKAVLRKYVKTATVEPDRGRLNFLLVLGVNGVGKTTTIAKLAHRFKKVLGADRVLLSAGDTFRAAAIDQLKLHGERLGLRVVSQDSGADPGAVMYDSIETARARGAELVLADTAGRMHNKANLVRELQKVDKVIKGRIGDGTYRTLLVIDATTGQNGRQQAEIFHEAIGVDSIALTKYDSTAKGGIVVSISRDLGIPFSFVGTGEKMDDLSPFDAEEYLDGLLDLS
jgi:fused signal recognition particle receptor